MSQSAQYAREDSITMSGMTLSLGHDTCTTEMVSWSRSLARSLSRSQSSSYEDYIKLETIPEKRKGVTKCIEEILKQSKWPSDEINKELVESFNSVAHMVPKFCIGDTSFWENRTVAYFKIVQGIMINKMPTTCTRETKDRKLRALPSYVAHLIRWEEGNPIQVLRSNEWRPCKVVGVWLECESKHIWDLNGTVEVQYTDGNKERGNAKMKNCRPTILDGTECDSNKTCLKQPTVFAYFPDYATHSSRPPEPDDFDKDDRTMPRGTQFMFKRENIAIVCEMNKEINKRHAETKIRDVEGEEEDDESEPKDPPPRLRMGDKESNVDPPEDNITKHPPVEYLEPKIVQGDAAKDTPGCTGTCRPSDIRRRMISKNLSPDEVPVPAASAAVAHGVIGMLMLLFGFVIYKFIRKMKSSESDTLPFYD